MRGKLVAGVVLAPLALPIAACGSSRPPTTKSELRWLGSAETIATAKVPEGPVFSFIGQQYRFWRHTYLQVDTRFAEPWRVSDAGRGSSWSDGTVAGRSRLLDEEISVAVGCQVRPFVIMRGLLKDPGDSVYAEAQGRMVRLRRAGLPAALGTHDALVYGAIPSAPSGFLLRTRSGGSVQLHRVGRRYSRAAGCAGEEGAWVSAHFSHAVASHVLALITRCMQDKGFEVGAPDPGSSPWLAHDDRLRQVIATQNVCRSQARAVYD